MPQILCWPNWSSFRTRFKEHAQDFRLGNHKSNFAKHLLDCQHTLHSIEDSMSILHISNKGRMLNTLERFHIYKETMHHNQINDGHTVSPNAIIEEVLSPTSTTWSDQFHANRTPDNIHSSHNLRSTLLQGPFQYLMYGRRTEAESSSHPINTRIIRLIHNTTQITIVVLLISFTSILHHDLPIRLPRKTVNKTYSFTSTSITFATNTVNYTCTTHIHVLNIEIYTVINAWQTPVTVSHAPGISPTKGNYQPPSKVANNENIATVTPSLKTRSITH
jgi:hypothetical protein